MERIAAAAKSGAIGEHLSALARVGCPCRVGAGSGGDGSSSSGELFFENLPRARVVLESITDTLNSSDVGSKLRVRALACLAALAQDEAGRDAVMDAVRSLDETFEKVLLDKEAGRQQYNTAVGDIHLLMVLLFFRVLDYRMSAADLLEMVRDDQRLSLELIGATAKVSSYENGVFLNACRIMEETTLPETYFGGADDEAKEQQISAFAARVDDMVKLHLATSLMNDTVSSALRRFFPATATALATYRTASRKKVAGQGGGVEYGGGHGGLQWWKAVQVVKDPKAHLAIGALFRMLQNLYLFSSGGADAVSFRQHVLTVTEVAALGIAQLCSAVSGICDDEGRTGSKDDSPETFPAHAAERCAADVLRVLTLACFRLPEACAVLRASNPTVLLIGNDDPKRFAFWTSRTRLLRLLLLLNINIDAFGGRDLSPTADCALAAGRLEELGGVLAAAVRESKLTVAKIDDAGWLPVGRDLPSYSVVRSMFDQGRHAAGGESQGNDVDGKTADLDPLADDAPVVSEEGRDDDEAKGSSAADDSRERPQAKQGPKQRPPQPPDRSSTGPLRLEDLKFDKKTADLITKRHIQRACAVNADGAGGDEDDDLYDF
eukprot:g2602.t1